MFAPESQVIEGSDDRLSRPRRRDDKIAERTVETLRGESFEDALLE